MTLSELNSGKWYMFNKNKNNANKLDALFMLCDMFLVEILSITIWNPILVATTIVFRPDGQTAH